MMNPEEFLRLLFGEEAPGHLVLWTRQDRESRWFPPDDLEAASQLTERLASTRDVYCGVALQDKEAAFAKWRADNPDKPGAPTTRGYSETAIAVPGLWADVDVRGPAHRQVNLPPTKTAALDLIQEFPLAPTIVVDSGHGLHVWWLFRELWTFDSEAERRQAQALARRFLATLQANARAHGWQIDPTSDLAQLLRLPGTWNHKLRPVPVRVIECNETSRTNPSDFEPYLVETSQTEDATARHWQGPSGAVAPVLKHCRFLQHCRDDAARLSEPEWWAMIGNLARLEGGREAIHALSHPYPSYSRQETETKIVHTLHAAGPHTCQYIQQQLGFTGCPPGGCGVKAPAALGLSQRDKRAACALQLRREAEETALRLFAKDRGEAT